jgi:hypothetical protein
MKFGEEHLVTEVQGNKIANPFWELPMNLEQSEPWPSLSEQLLANQAYKASHPGERARIHIFPYKPYADNRATKATLPEE